MTEFETELHELEFESELESEGIFGTIGNLLGGLLGEGESESEFHELEMETEFAGESELESEFESELNPVRKIYPDAMMEHLAYMASQAETEHEAAEHFLPLIGLAASKLLPVVTKALSPALKKVLPRVARAVTKVQPRLTRGIATIARGLHRNPTTRPLLRAVPSIARRTVYNVARTAAAGRPVTPVTAVRTLAAQTRRVLGTHPARVQAMRRSRLMDNRLHRHFGATMVRPHTAYWQRGGAGCACGNRRPVTVYCNCCGQPTR
jgi:hypothetical protein